MIELPLQDSTKHHMIVPNGYNIGRDLLVQSAITGSSWRGISWITDVEWREGLLEPGFKGIDHAVVNKLSFAYTFRTGINHAIAQDGRIAVLTVHRV